MTGTLRTLRIQALVALMCLVILLYLILLGRTAVILIGAQRSVATGLGVVLLILPAVGVWVVIATLRAGFTQQRLARLIAADQLDLDVSGLPRRRSGRIEPSAADALFDTVRAELRRDPADWRRWYRLARAYGYAGDRARARQAMNKAERLQSHS